MMKIGVLSETRGGDPRRFWSDARVEEVDAIEDVARPLKNLLDAQVGVVVVRGDDRLLSRVATAYHRKLADHDVPLRVAPVAVGTFTTVAAATGELEERKLARRLRAAAGADELRRFFYPTLRVTASDHPHAIYGFNFGMGIVYDFFEAFVRSGRGGKTGYAASVGRLAREALESAGRSLEPVDAHISVDYEPQTERVGYLLASSLERSWFDVPMRRGVGVRLGDNVLSLLGKGSRLGRLYTRATGQQADRFDRIHIDTHSGYVVDGELFAPARPAVVQIAPGPSIHFVV